MSGFFQKLFNHPEPESASKSGESIGSGQVPAPASNVVRPPISHDTKPVTVKSVPGGMAAPFRPIHGEPIRKLFPSPGESQATRVTLPPPRTGDTTAHPSPFELVEPPPAESAGTKLPEEEVLPEVNSPTVKRMDKTSAVTVSAVPAAGRAPLAPLVADSQPTTFDSPKPLMNIPSDPRPVASPIPFLPIPAATTATVPASAPATVPASAPVTSPVGVTSSEDDFGMDFRQLELRAVFGLATVLPAEGVFGLCSSLPGIKAAAYAVGESLVFQKAAGGTKLDAMPKAFVHLSALARDLGMRDARLLALHTEGGLLAFFSEGAGCLAVLHDGRKFAPGVKERLVIILRELARTAGMP